METADERKDEIIEEKEEMKGEGNKAIEKVLKTS